MSKEGKIEPVSYCGYNIWPEVKTIEKSNSLSGHQWTENKKLSSFYVAGPNSCVSTTFKTMEKAKEQIDFLIKHPSPVKCGIVLC